MKNTHTLFITGDKAFALGHTPSDIHQKNAIPDSLSLSPPVKKDGKRGGQGQLDLEGVQPPRLPFLASALLTGRPVAKPLSTLLLFVIQFIIKYDENP